MAAATTKKAEGGFVHAIKKTVGKITVDTTVDPKFTQAALQLNKFVDQVKQLKRLIGVYIRQQRALLQASVGVCDHFHSLIAISGAGDFTTLAETNKRAHANYLQVAVTDTKKDAGKTAAAVAALAAKREEKRGGVAGADDPQGVAVDVEEEEVGVDGKDIKQVVIRLAEVDALVAALRQRMKDREVETGEMDYYRTKVGKLRQEHEQQQKLRMEGKIRQIAPKDIARLTRNETHFNQATEKWMRTNTVLITDLNFIWNKRFDIYGHILAEYIRAEKGFYRSGISVNDEVIFNQRPRATPWSLLLGLREAAEPSLVSLGNIDPKESVSFPAGIGRTASQSVSSPPSQSHHLSVVTNGGPMSPVATAVGGAVTPMGYATPPPASGYPPSVTTPSSQDYSNPFGSSPAPHQSPPMVSTGSTPSSSAYPPAGHPSMASSQSSPPSAGYGYAPQANGYGAPPPPQYQAYPSPVAASQPSIGGIGGAAPPVITPAGSRRASLNPFGDDVGWNAQPEGQPNPIVYGSPSQPPQQQQPVAAVSHHPSLPPLPQPAVTPPSGVGYMQPAPVAAPSANLWDPFASTNLSADPWGSTDDPFSTSAANEPSPFGSPSQPTPAPQAVMMQPSVQPYAQQAAVTVPPPNPFDFLQQQQPQAFPSQSRTPSQPADPFNQQPQQAAAADPFNPFF